MKKITAFVLFTMVLTVFSGNVLAKPLRVYILAGQSNMEGAAKVETFDYIGDDPATATMLKEMRGPDGKPRVCDKVWISYFTGWKTLGECFGKLTAGYGSRINPSKSEGKIGPEFTFGIYMHKALNESILIIKTAWGGKSLHTDFRPPSAGPYEFNEWQKKHYAETGQTEKRQADIDANCHKYYRLMIEHVKKVLADPKRVCPAYNEKDGYEIAGFVWFQAWNDWCDGHVYPNRHKPDGYDLYSELMAHFIRDVRKDLATPKMPFVIGVMGVGGTMDPWTYEFHPGVGEKFKYFRRAMAAPAAMDEFKGNVVAVETAPYWDVALGKIEMKIDKAISMTHRLNMKDKNTPNKDGKMSEKQKRAYVKQYRAKLVSPEEEAIWKRGGSNGGYHYLGSAKIYGQIGKAFAEALSEMK